MPQLDTATFAPQLVWLAITFIGLYLILARAVLPRIASVLEERQERIDVNLEKAEALKVEAEARAVDEVRDAAVDIALNATRKLIEENVDEQKSDALVEDAIKELPDKLH